MIRVYHSIHLNLMNFWFSSHVFPCVSLKKPYNNITHAAYSLPAHSKPLRRFDALCYISFTMPWIYSDLNADNLVIGSSIWWSALKFIWNCCQNNNHLSPNLQKCKLWMNLLLEVFPIHLPHVTVITWPAPSQSYEYWSWF